MGHVSGMLSELVDGFVIRIESTEQPHQLDGAAALQFQARRNVSLAGRSGQSMFDRPSYLYPVFQARRYVGQASTRFELE
jgi:hypothetical protein